MAGAVIHILEHPDAARACILGIGHDVFRWGRAPDLCDIETRMLDPAPFLQAMPICFPLPAHVRVGDQVWWIHHCAVKLDVPRWLTVIVTLRGPYQRYRRARLTMPRSGFLAGRYDGIRAAALIEQRLPYSDSIQAIDVPARAFARNTRQAALPADGSVYR